MAVVRNPACRSEEQVHPPPVRLLLPLLAGALPAMAEREHPAASSALGHVRLSTMIANLTLPRH